MASLTATRRDDVGHLGHLGAQDEALQIVACRQEDADLPIALDAQSAAKTCSLVFGQRLEHSHHCHQVGEGVQVMVLGHGHQCCIEVDCAELVD